MMWTTDMSVRANQLFAALVGLYALQSLLLCLRWGYGLDAFAFWIGLLAPVLPVVAYFAYLSLVDRLKPAMFWPFGIVVLNWAVLILSPDLADPVILLTYLGFGFAILRHAYGGADELALVRIGQTDGALRAMVLTGLALVCSGFVDIFVIVDFIRTGGQHVGLSVTLAQSVFLLCIGLAAIAGRSGATDDDVAQVAPNPSELTEEDGAIIARLTHLFEVEHLHTDTELNLRRLSRKLGLPDRSVSRAINKTQHQSVSQFVNGFRIRDATRMLESSDQTILQISLAAGFMTKSNFNREFARVTGQTPSKWRQSKGM
jgi:AraC-like DNA-binding protein